ncbi:sodium:proton antiporter [Escherichia coli]|nr:sodium:proton antiporter [Escherichia coli]
MRSTLKARYGEKTKLKLIGAPRGLLSRLRPFGSVDSADVIGHAAGSLAGIAEERALWGRYGL